MTHLWHLLEHCAQINIIVHTTNVMLTMVENLQEGPGHKIPDFKWKSRLWLDLSAGQRLGTYLQIHRKMLNYHKKHLVLKHGSFIPQNQIKMKPGGWGKKRGVQDNFFSSYSLIPWITIEALVLLCWKSVSAINSGHYCILKEDEVLM